MTRTLDEVAYDLEVTNAKIKELEGTKALLELSLIDLIGKKDEGTTTSKSKFYKASTVGKVNRSFDSTFLFKDLVAVLGVEKATSLAKPKYSLSLTEYRELSDEDKLAVSRFITSKPAKTSVKVERVEVAA